MSTFHRQNPNQRKTIPWIPNGSSSSKHISYKINDPRHPNYGKRFEDQPHANTKTDNYNYNVDEASFAQSSIHSQATLQKKYRGLSGGPERRPVRQDRPESPQLSLTQSEQAEFELQEHKHASQSALKNTTAHRKYGMVSMRSSAAMYNKKAMESFHDRLDSCLDKFDQHTQETREQLYKRVEEETGLAIEKMEDEVASIQKEVAFKYKAEAAAAKDEVMGKAMESLELQFQDKERELVRRLEAEGPDVIARQIAHEEMEKEIKATEARIQEEHRKALEQGALARLKEREAQLNQQRDSIIREMEEDKQQRMKELSERLSRDAKNQISAYRLELENLREARTTSARTKEAEKTAEIVQGLKAKFIEQANEELKLASVGAEEEENYALKQVADEIARFQALKATEITTNARAHRAETLPGMAIELEERAEGIERHFRMGLMNEDTKEETELVNAAIEELTGHVNGATEAVVSDNEQFVTHITDAFHKARATVLKARATYLKIPTPSGGRVEDSLNSSMDVRASDPSGSTGVGQISIKELTSNFEQMRQKYLTIGTRITDASIENLLLQHEVKASRVRRAENLKNGVAASGSRGTSNCPSCKPLMEANLELQRVASKKRQQRSGRRDSNTFNFGGGSFRNDMDDSGLNYDVTPNLIKSKYGGGGGGDDDDVSISSTESSREADFVKRFLGKVTKNSTTLRGTIARLGPVAKFGESPLESTASRFRAESAKGEERKKVRREPSTPFDEMISSALSTSALESHQNVKQKQKYDEKLVKKLLETTVGGNEVSMRSDLTEDRSALDFMEEEGRGRGRRRNDDSFEAGRAAVIAPGLEDKKVKEWIEGHESSSSDDEE